MFGNFELTFTPICASYVKQTYSGVNLIVEYGTGGSTLFAASAGRTVLAVESSINWLMRLMSAYKEQNLPGDIVPLWANIGETKEWGHPVDASKRELWPNYAKLPWDFCSEHTKQPELVMIDGRFRAACFLATCCFTQIDVRVLFDDFADRPGYHFVQEIIKPTEVVDHRMAIFDVKPGLVSPRFVLDKIGCFFDPA